MRADLGLGVDVRPVAEAAPRPVIIPTPREGVVLLTSENAYDT
jgi:hypothetical protein